MFSLYALPQLFASLASLPEPTKLNWSHWRDHAERFDINFVSRLQPGDWQPLATPDPNLGFVKGSHWFLGHLEPYASKRVLTIEYAVLDHIHVFFIDRASRQILAEYQTGDAYPFDSRPLPYLTYAFPIPVDESMDVVVNVQTKGNLVLPSALWSYDHFIAQATAKYVVIGIILGCLLVTAIYNLLVYVRIKEPLFLAFSLFTLSVMLIAGAQSGLWLQLAWSSQPAWNERSILVFMALSGASHFYFSAMYLQLRGALARFFNFWLLLYLCAFVLALLLDYADFILPMLMAAMLATFSSLSVSLYLLFKGNRNAPTYLLGWSGFAIGIFFAAAIRFELVPFNPITEFSGVIGALANVLVLSASIADKINREKQTRLEAQNQAISNLSKFEDLYQNAIEGLFVCRLDGQLIRGNKSFLSMTNIEENALPNTNVRSFFKDQDQFKALYDSMTQDNKVVGRELEVTLNGKKSWVILSMRLVQDDQDKHPFVEGIVLDISARKKVEAELSHLATHDALTGLINRHQLELVITPLIKDSQESGAHHALVYVDIFQFKRVNELIGFSSADQILKKFANMLVKDVGEAGKVARVAGDEFVIFMQNTSVQRAEEYARKILAHVSTHKFNQDQQIISIAIDIGISEIDFTTSSFQQALIAAETACSVAKEKGLNRIYSDDAEQDEPVLSARNVNILADIKQALMENNLSVKEKMVITNTPSQLPVHKELHVQMLDSHGKMLSPSEFLPVAAKYSLISQIDTWVFWRAIQQIQLGSELQINVNFAASSLYSSAAMEQIRTGLASISPLGGGICFEINEVDAIQNQSSFETFVQSVKEFGAKVALDNVGSAYSSFSLLSASSIDYIKLDTRIFPELLNSKVQQSIVSAWVNIADEMGIHTIATRVDDAALVMTLRELGVNLIQGDAINR